MNSTVFIKTVKRLNEFTSMIIPNYDICLLIDIAKYKNPEAPVDMIKNWVKNRSTIEFLGLWERINNSSLKLNLKSMHLLSYTCLGTA